MKASTYKMANNNVFEELNAQDEVASMMEDDEVMDQLEEIGREQRNETIEEVKMGPPAEKSA